MTYENENISEIPEEQDENLLEHDIPEKFKNTQTGEVNISAMAKSYKMLEQKLARMPKPVKSPNEYCIECEHGMFRPDEEVNQRMFEMGLSHDQAQEVYNLAAEKMMPMIKEMHADMVADREVEKLITHFGGTEQWKNVSKQLLAFGHKNLPEDVLDNLASSYEGVLALHRMMKGNEPNLQRTSAKASGNMDGAELSSMMRDPKYWRDKDPAFIAKVTQGFESLYGK